MLKYTIRRLLLLIPTLFVVLLVTFALAHAAPGGPWDKDESKKQTQSIINNLNAKYGLDKPLPEQFGLYVWNAMHGDFGVSLTYRDRLVTDIIGDAWPISARLGVQAILLAVAISIPLGVISALKQNTLVDSGSLLFATAGTSIPSFVLAIFAIYIFSVNLRWFPASGWAGGDLSHLVMPTVLLAIGSSAFLTRITRASMLEAIRQDYVRTARAKGLKEQVVVVTHVLRNALIPVVTVLGPATAFVITGTFFIEYIFSIPGLGRFFINSILARDYPMILAIYLLFALVISVANLTVDLAYGLLDPRIKVSR
ncbi:MAG: ABC transporter permease [Chloroflexi bacterium]|nr:MAG: ABC transporter permease [Chloroflexota bacterium]